MRQRLQRLLIRILRALKPKPDPQIRIAELASENRIIKALLTKEDEQQRFGMYMGFASEMVEAKMMAGSGPPMARAAEAEKAIGRIAERAMGLREALPLSSQGAFGDIELALQNIEWRREISVSWLEFSRWGVQQIILIARLYYIKNPIIRRLIDICAFYTFGRGVEISSPDKDADDVLKDFLERNKSVIGHHALTKLEKRKYYDGNLFFALFADEVNEGKTDLRMMDATEIGEIITDPDDSEKPWFYLRSWSPKQFDITTGVTTMRPTKAYYPALGYDPAVKPDTIASFPVHWECRVLHRKCGEIAQWTFGVPSIYPALDWAKSSREYLEACKTFAKSLAQFAWTLTTKGGQQAIEGAKQQLGTTVNASGGNNIWDENPTANNASIFVSGTGTELSSLSTRGKGSDPEEVRRYLLMCCMVVGVPETFLADVSTGNLATATTLDRPTELCFLEKQEAWREDLLTICQYVVSVSKGAPSGKMSGLKMGSDPKPVEINVTFPAIVQGDIPAQIGALVEAMTLQNKGGQIVGIDERAGVRKLYEILDIDDGDELIEKQYPDSEYDPDRTKEPLPAPIPKLQDAPAGTIPGGQGIVQPKPFGAAEALRHAAAAVELYEEA